MITNSALPRVETEPPKQIYRKTNLISERCYYISLVFTLLAGVLLIGLEIGFLLFHVLSASWIFSVAVAAAIAVSTALFGLAMYQIVSRYKEANSVLIEEAKYKEQKADLENLRLQTALSSQQLAHRNYEQQLIEKISCLEKNLYSIRKEMRFINKEKDKLLTANLQDSEQLVFFRAFTEDLEREVSQVKGELRELHAVLYASQDSLDG
ncbi:hypothetical protein [Chlamydia vaughanii]|uniref:hypothetical protein n=1 Tax=Chlamydia vaughanii TaxID=3112552 RepID=UPI0039F629C7